MLLQDHRSYRRHRHHVMEPHTITIGGKTVSITWNQGVARRLSFRASSIGGGPSFADFSHPQKAASAIVTFLWLLLPPEVHRRFPTPEDLYADIAETEAPAIHAGILSVVREMFPDEDEKKNSPSTPLPESNSG